jgi:hypothetical protein
MDVKQAGQLPKEFPQPAADSLLILGTPPLPLGDRGQDHP